MIIKPLRVWVQNILPVVYDDSLSYLEIVAKINAKTNEIISQTNENTQAIETLAEVIAELGDVDELKALLDEVKTIVEDLYTTDEPLMDGEASAGSADHAARSDHVHPSDTNKANKDLDINSSTVNQYVKILAVDENGKPTAFGSGTPSGGSELSDNNPVMNGTASAGNGNEASRYNHVHPSDTTKLNTDGDGSNVTTAFTVASSRTNIATGEKLSILFGKIAKWFSDLGTAAFRAATSRVTRGSTDLVESGTVFNELNGKAKNNELAIVITGARPSTVVSVGQYVLVRDSIIVGITDGLYKAVNALSPSTDVTMSDLSAVSIGGLNNIGVIKDGSFTVNSSFTYDVCYVMPKEQNGLVLLYVYFKANFTANQYTRVGVVSPPPPREILETVSYGNQTALIDIYPDGNIDIYPYDINFTGYIRHTIPYFL